MSDIVSPPFYRSPVAVRNENAPRERLLFRPQGQGDHEIWFSPITKRGAAFSFQCSFCNRTTLETAATAFFLYILVAPYPVRFVSSDRTHFPTVFLTMAK